MKFSARKMTLAVVAAIILVLWLADEYPALRFRGDASFSGGPVFGYSVKMRRIPFYQPGEYIYHLRGLPNEEMSLQLYAEGKSLANEAEITRIETTIEAVLADQTRRIVCQASGSPLMAAGKIDESNPRMGHDAGTRRSGILARTVLGYALETIRSYTLTIRVRNVDPNTPKFFLIPTLRVDNLTCPD